MENAQKPPWGRPGLQVLSSVESKGRGSAGHGPIQDCGARHAMPGHDRRLLGGGDVGVRRIVGAVTPAALLCLQRVHLSPVFASAAWPYRLCKVGCRLTITWDVALPVAEEHAGKTPLLLYVYILLLGAFRGPLAAHFGSVAPLPTHVVLAALALFTLRPALCRKSNFFLYEAYPVGITHSRSLSVPLAYFLMRRCTCCCVPYPPTHPLALYLVYAYIEK